MKHIKDTTSICSTCLKYLYAEVTEEDNGIFLYRKCPEHGMFHNIIERDINFYKAAANIDKKRFIDRLHALVLPVTDRCNLKCRFCYYTTTKNEVLAIYKIIEIAKSTSMGICLSGGEPTLHPDLFEIINRLKKIDKPIELLTNGLELANPNYVRCLKDAGLKKVLFSLNGFDNSILEQIDSEPCLKQKLNAIENLKNQDIEIQLSLSLLRGVNESELKKAIEFCLRNINSIPSLRIRSFSRIGRSENIPTLTAGEMVAILADALYIEKGKLIKGVRTRRLSSSTQYNAFLYFYELDNKFEFLAEEELYPPIGLMKIRLSQILVLIAKTSNARGIKRVAKVLLNILRGKGKIVRLKINMWSWPDRYNLDLQEINSHGIAHLNSKLEIDNFYKALILDNSNSFHVDILNSPSQ